MNTLIKNRLSGNSVLCSQRIKNHEKVKKSFQNVDESADVGDTGFGKAASSAAQRQGGM